MRRRINDGDDTGMKRDKFRHSRFDTDVADRAQTERYAGVERASANTINGPYYENRGRRAADSTRSRWDGSPFENGRIYNWGRREENRDIRRGNKKYGDHRLDHGHFGKGPRGYKRADDSIYEDVCRTLELSPDVDASDIEVSVKEGIVYLNGNVENRNAKKMAELEIENISGVHDVQNLLSIETKSNKDLH